MKNQYSFTDFLERSKEILLFLLGKLIEFLRFIGGKLYAFHKFRPRNAPKPLRNRIRIFLFPCILLFDELILRLFGGDPLFGHFFYVFIFLTGLSLLFAFLSSLLKAKYNRIISQVLLFLTSAFFATESVIKSVFTTYMSPGNLISAAGNVAGTYGGEMARAIIFSIPKILVFFLPVWAYIKFGKPYVSMKRLQRRTSVILLVCSFAVTGIGALTASLGSYSGLYGAQFDYSRATRTFGLITSTRLSLKYNLFGNNHNSFNAVDDSVVTQTNEETYSETESVSETVEDIITGQNVMDLPLEALTNSSSDAVSSLSSYLLSQTASDKNAYTGLFEGKNLIMVCAESYCNAFISEELTPTLWRLSHNGFYFSEYYQPEWGGSTTTGELSYTIGLAPRDGDESMINLIDNNNYFTMGNQLQRLGYSSCAFHNGENGYYRRNETHPNLGYNQFIANETGMADLCGYNYAHDSTMVEKTIDYYIDKQPFSIYYMTISGHAPYQDADTNELTAKHLDFVNSVVGDEYEEVTKYYICYQMELENAMKVLVERLEDAGIADDTVIVLVGDHYPYGLGTGEAWGNDQNYIADLMKSSVSNYWQEDSNGLIIWSGCLENEYRSMWKEISTPTFSLDILPTLSNLFGLEYDSRLLPGRDVFDDSAMPLVFWNNFSWVTECGKYDSNTETYYPNDGYEYDQTYVSQINSIVENKLLMSREIMETDFYGILFGEDTVTFAGQQIFPTS